MTMFNITDGNNNVSRDKPVEHIDMVIGLHVSACTSCTRTIRVRRDIAIDITEAGQLLVRFNALRSTPVMPKLEHYNQNAMRSMAAAALATQAAAANARARPRLAGQCEYIHTYILIVLVSMLPTVPGMLVLVEYSNDEIRPMVATALQHFLHSSG